VSSPPYIYNLPSGYFKKEITGQHWSGPKWQIDYKIKGKKRNVSSSSEYSINHQDPKVDGTTRIFHNHQKTQRADSLKKNKIPSIIRTQRLMEQQEYSIIIRRPKEEIHDEGKNIPSSSSSSSSSSSEMVQTPEICSPPLTLV
jgi:hypothetical protein